MSVGKLQLSAWRYTFLTHQAAAVVYGLPALAIRQAGSSCYHNGSLLSICEVQNVTKIQNCYAPDANLKLKNIQYSFLAGFLPWTRAGELATFPQIL